VGAGPSVRRGRQVAEDNLAAGVSVVVLAPFLRDVDDSAWRVGWEAASAGWEWRPNDQASCQV
jgi:hypothetical protein